jgi:hypothetical protein
MSFIVTRKAPLRAGRRWDVKIVATEQKWFLSITHFAPESGVRPRYYEYGKRKCLGLLLDAKRAWWKVSFAKKIKSMPSRTDLRGEFIWSEMVQIRSGYFGDHMLVFGAKIRTKRSFDKFRRELISSMKMGRGFRKELLRNKRVAGRTL